MEIDFKISLGTFFLGHLQIHLAKTVKRGESYDIGNGQKVTKFQPSRSTVGLERVCHYVINLSNAILKAILANLNEEDEVW